MFIEPYNTLKEIFHDENKALLYLIDKNYVNKYENCDKCGKPTKLNLSKKLYVCKFYKCRKYIRNKQLVSPKIKIGGRNTIVEMDETKIAKRKYHKGRKIEGAWIIGG